MFFKKIFYDGCVTEMIYYTAFPVWPYYGLSSKSCAGFGIVRIELLRFLARCPLSNVSVVLLTRAPFCIVLF